MTRRRQAQGINAAAWFNAQSFHDIPAPTPARQPTPIDDVREILVCIEGHSACELRQLGNVTSIDLRKYIDRVRNALQALEACAASLEAGK